MDGVLPYKVTRIEYAKRLKKACESFTHPARKEGRRPVTVGVARPIRAGSHNSELPFDYKKLRKVSKRKQGCSGHGGWRWRPSFRGPAWGPSSTWLR